MYPEMSGLTPGYYDPRTGQFYHNPAAQLGQQPYLQPQLNYQNATPQMPYQQQQAQQAPTPPPQPQPTNVAGRMVDDISEVKPNEVPMDGTFCYFPLRNGTKIFVKVWDSNAQLRTFCFIPEEPVIQAQENAEKQGHEEILASLDEIKTMLSDIRTVPPVGKKKEDK